MWYKLLLVVREESHQTPLKKKTHKILSLVVSREILQILWNAVYNTSEHN